MFPILVLAQDGGDSNYAGPVGYFPHVRALNVANLNPRDEIVLGPDVWAAYPSKAKAGVLADVYVTRDYGYAFLKG